MYAPKLVTEYSVSNISSKLSPPESHLLFSVIWLMLIFQLKKKFVQIIFHDDTI